MLGSDDHTVLGGDRGLRRGLCARIAKGERSRKKRLGETIEFHCLNVRGGGKERRLWQR